MNYIKNIAILEKSIEHRFTDFLERTRSQYPCLDCKELTAYSDSILDKQRIDGIIGGQQSNLLMLDKYFIKKLSGVYFMNEACIYYMINKLHPKLAQFMIKCFGVLFVKSIDKLSSEHLDALIQSNTISKDSEQVFVPFDQYTILFLWLFISFIF